MSQVYEIPEANRKRALINEEKYKEIYEWSVKDPAEFWSSMAEEFLHWDKKWKRVFEFDFHAPKIEWFAGGKLNVSFNCVDRHAAKHPDKIAIIWEGNEPGEHRKISYQELQQEVGKFANVFRSLGVVKGDRVALYLPMIPELAFAMLACARIGAVHSVVFAGFSADSLAGRIQDCQAKLLVTADEGLRGNKKVPLKEIADEALESCPSIEKSLIVKRTNISCSFREGRDVWLEDVYSRVDAESPVDPMDAEDPLFILYTSGSTGQPKGVLHSSAGYLLYAAVTHKYIFDYHEGDVYCCAADIGWITGHSYIVYGPLANGATTMMFESVPTYPDSGRYWDMVERYKVTSFYTAPTAIRAIQKDGRDLPEQYDLSSLRILGTVGEPINADAWEWYYEKVGRSQCAVVDTWWQTETGVY